MYNSKDYEVVIPLVMSTKGPIRQGSKMPSLSDFEIEQMLKKGLITLKSRAKSTVKIDLPDNVSENKKSDLKPVQQPIKEIMEKTEEEPFLCDICGRKDFASKAGFKAHYRRCKQKHSEK